MFAEAMAHCCLALASHPVEQRKLALDDAMGTYMDLFLTEVLRVCRVMKLLVIGYCDNSVCEKDWRCRKRGTQAT